MINVFKENKELKKEIKQLNEIINNNKYIDERFIKREQYYTQKIDYLEEKIIKLQKELTELYEKNYELAKKHNNDNNLDISGVTCDYAIDRLKDIIK